MTSPYPDGTETAIFGMGCFWGAERLFWQLDGVWVTAVGYAGGFTLNPTYDEVCSARTGHAEVVSQPAFYFAEGYHQQYLEANPSGYCGLKGTGVSCPIGSGIRG
ncbi:MAG: peptide-methionine (S)-S-oxide reductase, partial [Candidatus Dormibacteraeota bacterium]|nr:peptide-methionine (S)-S-oxide reductase [Candidatus Dormibacteraeota bacterium]